MDKKNNQNDNPNKKKNIMTVGLLPVGSIFMTTVRLPSTASLSRLSGSATRSIITMRSI